MTRSQAGKTHLLKRKGAKRLIALSFWVALPTAAYGQQSYSSSPDSLTLARRAVLAGQFAYVVLAPDAVSGPSKVRVVWASPSGAYLMILRSTIPQPRLVDLFKPPSDVYIPGRADLTVSVWDVERRQSSLLWRGVVSQTQIAGASVFGFLPGTSSALGQIVTAPRTGNNKEDEKTAQARLVFFDAARSTVRTLASIEPGTDVRICPTQPKAALLSPRQDWVQIIREDGMLGRRFPIAVPSGVYWYNWKSDEQTLYGRADFPAPSGDKDAPPQAKTILLNTQTGQVTFQDGLPPDAWGRPQYAPPCFDIPLQADFGEAQLTREGTTEMVRPLWLVGVGDDAEGRVLLAPDAAKPLLLPDLDKPLVLPGAVVYESQGTLYAAPLVRTNRDVFVASRHAAYKAVTLARAKQVRSALEKYSTENHELPPLGVDPQTWARYLYFPEAVNNPATGRFGLKLVYTHLRAFNLPNQDTVVLGYLNGLGGRAVIYAGSRVEWQDDPTSTKP